MNKIYLFSLCLSYTAFIAFCTPQGSRRELATEKPNEPVTNGELHDLVASNHKEVKPFQNSDKQGFSENASFGYLQTVRKEWKCVNGQCQEHITKCKNGRCDSVENRFKADQNFQPEIPSIHPISIPEFKFPDFNFAELFKLFEKFDFPSPFNFDNSGIMDLVVDPKNSEYYFTNAKFVNSKCANRVCEIKTRTCVNEKCDEKIENRSF